MGLSEWGGETPVEKWSFKTRGFQSFDPCPYFNLFSEGYIVYSI